MNLVVEVDNRVRQDSGREVSVELMRRFGNATQDGVDNLLARVSEHISEFEGQSLAGRTGLMVQQLEQLLATSDQGINENHTVVEAVVVSVRTEFAEQRSRIQAAQDRQEARTSLLEASLINAQQGAKPVPGAGGMTSVDILNLIDGKFRA